ncbi:MAG: metal-sulfur cluster assembly factor [Elusimicrobia bacterium]|nr:metal-sulfur cluster assembly factor [Elusimicrobiota bacterium]
MPATKDIAKALEPVIDPEIHLSIVDLGLIYGIDVDGGKVDVFMTLTTPMCPYGPMLQEATKRAVETVPGVTQAEVKLIWEPAWDPHQMCTEDAKINLGIMW